MSSEVEEIKNRLNVVDLVGEYVRLSKAGSNYKALCPFHNEKSPSFMVSEERGSWHCFGCGKGGDIFSFLMEMEGIGFREALEQLAEKTGVELKKYSRDNLAGPEQRDDKSKLFAILELATKWYEKNLWEGKEKEKILGYLRGRGLTDASIKKFRLGYAPDGWRNILDFLSKRGYGIDEINKTGLLVDKLANSEQRVASNKVDQYYDRFRNRIMFPIQDIAGRVVGYSARVAPGGDEKNAKYINTPQTALYDKSKILYGLNFAKIEIKKRNETVMVEGNLDVIAAHQAGFAQTIAVSGTALTEEQVKILKRYAENLKMGFDMDAAGQAAARRSIKTCLENDLNVKIIRLSSGKDAADSLRENPEIWRQAVESAEGIMEYYFKDTFSRYDPKNPTDKKKIAKELLNIIKDIADSVERAHWVKVLAEKIGTEERILFDILSKAKSQNTSSPKSPPDEKIKRGDSLEEKIIGVLLAFPEEGRKELGRLDPGDFQNERERVILGAIKKNETNFSLENIKALFSDYETQKFLAEAVFEAEVKFSGELDGQKQIDPVEELCAYIDKLKGNKLRKRITRLSQDIKTAEASGDREATKSLMEEFLKLMEEMKK